MLIYSIIVYQKAMKRHEIQLYLYVTVYNTPNDNIKGKGQCEKAACANQYVLSLVCDIDIATLSNGNIWVPTSLED